jgi:hypothetical protein
MFLTVCSPFHLILDDAGDGDPSSRSKRLQSRGNIDALTVDVVALDDDFAEIDSDAIMDAFGIRDLRVGPLGGLLDGQRAEHCGAYTRELDQRAIADELEQSAAVDGEMGVENSGTIRLETFERPGLVDFHESAISDHVG